MLSRSLDFRVSLLAVFLVVIAGVAVPAVITAQSADETEKDIEIEVQDSANGYDNETVPITIESGTSDDGDGGTDRPADLSDAVSTDAFNAVDSDGSGDLSPSEIALAISENSNNGSVDGVEVSPSEFALMISWNADQ